MKNYLGDRLYISTIDRKAPQLAEKYGLGLEIADFCVGSNLDDDFVPYGREGLEKMKLGLPMVFHCPFAELSPCAIDPKVRQVVLYRHRQALHFALQNGINRLVVHGGYVPLVYFPQWFVAESIKYWKAFLESEKGDFTIYLDNVMDDDSCMLKEIVRRVDDPRLRLCLDVGHSNCISPQSVEEWVEIMGEDIGHVHIHNNDGCFDQHRPLDEGTLQMEKVLDLLTERVPDCSFTIECMDAESSVLWLKDRGYLG